jgi:outer membrane protein OmpA-like peptidoglycan-associated protein
MAVFMPQRSPRSIVLGAAAGIVMAAVAGHYAAAAAAEPVTQPPHQLRDEPKQTPAPQPSSQQLLSRALDALNARVTRQGRVVTLPSARFAEGRTTFAAADQTRLDQIVSVLHEFPKVLVVVEGFTDSSGSTTTNMRISQQRAQAARRGLIARGVEGARILTKAMAAAQPVADNSTPTGRELNRRVELVFSDAEGRLPAAHLASPKG